jgi:heme/copper-type cytochrome/quinol oxidase subunit 1
MRDERIKSIWAEVFFLFLVALTIGSILFILMSLQLRAPGSPSQQQIADCVPQSLSTR